MTDTEECKEEAAYRDNLWKLIENGIPAKVPNYIKNILHLSGYEDVSVLRKIDLVKIQKLEEFTRNKIMELNEIELKKYFHFYNKNHTKFEILQGHKDMLLEIGIFVDKCIKKHGNNSFSLKVPMKKSYLGNISSGINGPSKVIESHILSDSNSQTSQSTKMNLNHLSTMLYEKLKSWTKEKNLKHVSFIIYI